MTVEPTIEQLLTGGESAELEFKASLAATNRIVETIAAMATIGGGTILIGVRDDGEVVGADVGEGKLEQLVQQVLTGTDPRVFVDIDRPVVEGKRLVRIRIRPGDGPHLAYGRAFYRSGPATVAMSRDEYERRLLDRLRESSGFERRVLAETGLDDLDPVAVDRFVELAGLRSRLPASNLDTSDSGISDVVARLHLLAGGHLTIAGNLLFGRSPQGPLPSALIRARATRGANEDTRSIEGTLLDQIENAAAFVLRNLKTRPVRDGVRRADLSELPSAAVREVIANAVAHRDYRSTAPIQLRLDDDALEIWNPGHLPPPLTVASLREPHPSIPPNPLIARALYLAGYIEEWGTGTLRMIDAMRAAGNPEPMFESTGDSGLRVVLPLPGAVPPGTPDRAIRNLARIAAGETFRSAHYAEVAGISLRTAAGDLAILERTGLVRRVGQGRATRWRKA